MSLLPYNFGDFSAALPRPWGINPDDFFPPAMYPGFAPSMALPGYVRPWRFTSGPDSGFSKIINDKEKFEVTLDVKLYKPEEITVKNAENVITVEGKHEEKEDEHGFVSRHFKRRYVLPENVEIAKCKVQLSSDGVLTFSIPKKALPDPSKSGRVLPITKTGVPSVKAAETKK
ncbi:alpha-crystallin A chain-like [Neocloeon triangulifer]|uniref:alpha-crystallin A chain-like n=1 Tax=Neocloeon triangulifer TaxID=2078957 RepID=UPI00286ED8CA|nr:alpha-crystallin A chain-like [Neocloeon triangulifer]